ncbi:MAG: hypothetical protein AMS14_00295 [Planctomycetes bacterium DG_20]|nr:MAG: hypothetical protein AMS14_00295 [Planctomycetes bacterium DG_20]
MHVGKVNGIGWKARIVAAAKHRPDLGKPLLLGFLPYRLDAVFKNLLGENGPRLAYKLRKNPCVPSPASTDVGNHRAFAQAKAGKDRAKGLRPVLWPGRGGLTGLPVGLPHLAGLSRRRSACGPSLLVGRGRRYRDQRHKE